VIEAGKGSSVGDVRERSPDTNLGVKEVDRIVREKVLMGRNMVTERAKGTG
jgi:hypothetical protein